MGIFLLLLWQRIEISHILRNSSEMCLLFFTISMKLAILGVCRKNEVSYDVAVLPLLCF